MVTTLGRVVTYKEELSLIRLHDLSITLFMRSQDNLNTSYLHSHQTNGHKIWPGANIP